jgi:cbb3-type cytochrome oxidase cytochrome c subunit
MSLDDWFERVLAYFVVGVLILLAIAVVVLVVAGFITDPGFRAIIGLLIVTVFAAVGIGWFVVSLVNGNFRLPKKAFRLRFKR